MKIILKHLIGVINEITNLELNPELPFFSLAKKVRFKRGELIFKSGTICKAVWFVHKGLGRYKMYNETEGEFSANFFQEGDFVTDYSSFFSKTQSNIDIEALENMTLLQFNEDFFFTMQQDIIIMDKLFRSVLERYQMNCQIRLQNSAYKNKMLSYKALIKQFPNIEQRVSQRIIASYLDISPEHLCKIRSEYRNK